VAAAVLALAALVAGCSHRPNNLSDGSYYADPTVATSTPATVAGSSPAPPTTSASPLVDTGVLRQKVLADSRVAVEEFKPVRPAAAWTPAPLPSCRIDLAPAGRTVAVRAEWSTGTGADLVQHVVAHPDGRAAEAVERAREGLTCTTYTDDGRTVRIGDEAKLAEVDGVDDRFAWCERVQPGPAGRATGGRCHVVLAHGELLTHLMVSTLSEERARERLNALLPHAVAALTDGAS